MTANIRDRLTARERQVLLLLATDLDNQQIAEHLSVSRHTLQHHITSLYAKLGCPDRARAIVRGWRCGLIRSDERNLVASASKSGISPNSDDGAQHNVVTLWIGDSSSRAWHVVMPSQFEDGRAECGITPDQRNGNPDIWGCICSTCMNELTPERRLVMQLSQLSICRRCV